MDAALRCALGFIFKNVLSSSSSSLVNGAKVLLSSLPITNAPHLEARWKGSQSVSQSAIQADQTAVACPCADVYACGWGFCFALVCLSSQQQQLGQQWWLANRPAGNCQSNPNRIHHRWFPVTSSDPFQNGLIRRRRHSRRRGKKTILFKQNHGKIRPKGLRGMFNIDGQSHPSKLYDLDTHKMMLLNVADWIVIVYHVNRLVVVVASKQAWNEAHTLLCVKGERHWLNMCSIYWTSARANNVKNNLQNLVVICFKNEQEHFVRVKVTSSRVWYNR